MARLEFDRNDFDLDGFVQSFIKYWESPQSVMPWFDHTPAEQDDGVDWREWLRGEDHTVFLPFAPSYADEPVRCVDGTVVDPDDESLDPDQLGATTFAEDASYGYEVALEKERVLIDFVLDAELPESVDDAGVFERPMREYVERFVRA